MNYRKCNPLYGYRWFVESIKLFVSQPWPWLALVGVTLLLLLVLSLLPFMGLVAIFALFPAFAAGFMVASRTAMDHHPISFQHLLVGFRASPRPLMTVGVILFLIFFVAVLIILLGWRVEFQHLVALMQSETSDKEIIVSAAQQLTRPSLMVLAVLFLLTIATWFAPALVMFHRVEARTAMFLSFRACLSNFFPFLLFCLLLFLLDMATSLLLRQVIKLVHGIGGEQFASITTMLFTFPVFCSFLAILFAAAYISFMDVFEFKPSA